MKARYLLLATLCFTLTLLVALLIGDVLGYHYFYTAQDPGKQVRDTDNDGTDAIENWMSAYWALTPGASSIRYYVDESSRPSSAPPKASATPSVSLVLTAVSDWENATSTNGDRSLSSLDWRTPIHSNRIML